jgi:Kef-type K+ transport system membrane component KefB
MESAFTELAALLAVAAVLGALAVKLRQPLLLAYLVVGVLVGPAVFGWTTSHEQVELLAELGVTLLLFVVGLKLDMGLVRHLGPVALATGLGQLAFTSIFGFLLCLGLGMDVVKSIYVAIALTFSSTIIVVKLLSDKREIDSLHGRIAMGFLIVQDIAVVIAMMLMGSLRGEEGNIAVIAGSVALRLAVALLLIVLLMRYVLPRLTHLLASSQELLLIFAIAWGTALAASGEFFGFSKEVGAFLAGFSLASTVYREAIGARLASLRDFLLLFFFVALGAKLDFASLGGELWPALVLSLFVLVGNPLIVMAIMGWMGYRARTGLLAGLTVAQISEFSIVFIAMGITLGHVGVDALGLVTLVGVVTITLSTYMIIYSHQLHHAVARWLPLFERRDPFRENAAVGEDVPVEHADVIVFGLGRYGSRLVEHLRNNNLRVLCVDFDPEVVRRLHHRGVPAQFGDAGDPEFLESLPLRSARWVVSTLPQPDINVALLGGLREHGYRGATAVAAHHDGDGRRLTEAGATRVLYPFRDAADFAAEHIEIDLQPEAKP